MKLGLCAGVALAAIGMAMAPAHAADTIKIGAVLPFSGPGTSWGISLAGAAEIVAEEANAAGGVEVGGEKHTVEVIRYDDKLQASEAVSVMNRLVFQDGVKFALTVGSASTLAITPMATESEVLIISQAFANQTLAQDAPYTFRVIMPSSEFAHPQIKWVSDKLGVKSVGGLFPNDESGQQVAKDLAAPYEANGVKMQSEFFERDRVDFVPLITRLVAAGIEAIDLDGNSPATAGLIVKQAREAGFKGPIIRTGGESTVDIINVAGAEASEGLYVHMPSDLFGATVAPLKEKFEAKYGIPMSAAAVPEYAGVKLLLAAIQKAGSIDDVPAIAKAMEGLAGEPTILGPASWVGKNEPSGTVYENGHQMMYPFYVGQVEGGKVRIAATCDPTACK
jgi:branched-chain amino acid transport system substrate-binding protein